MKPLTRSYCAGCVSSPAAAGRCAQCGWNDAAQAESHDHLPRNYLLLSRYYIGRVLGQGGFGVTYLARDLTLNRPVAIKEYLPHEQCTRHQDRVVVVPRESRLRKDYEVGLQRFLDEARSLAQFGEYPGIVHVMDFYEANGTAYFVMPYLHGMTLKQHLGDRGGKIPPETALQVMMPVLDALREVHRYGILHRDVSPDNIFLVASGHVKLLDFGAARYAIGEHSKSLSTILKPGYAPEEQYRTHGRQGPWTDVYAAAATIYRCITGLVPPTALDRLSEDELVRPSVYCSSLSPSLEKALLQGLAVHAENRFGTVEQFQQTMLGAPISKDPGSASKRKDRGQPSHANRAEFSPFSTSRLRKTPMLATLGASAVILAAVLIWQIVQPAGSPSQGDGSPSPSTQQAVQATPTPQTEVQQPDAITADGPKSPRPNEAQNAAPELEQLLRSETHQGSSPKSDAPQVSAALLEEEKSNNYQTAEFATVWATVDGIFDEGSAKLGNSLIHIYLQNNCDKTIRVANKVKIPEESKWLTIGWRMVGPGQQINTHYITTTATVYSYAETLDGAVAWNGADNAATASDAIVSDSIFAHDEDEAASTKARKVSMFAAQFGTWGIHTVVFECK